MYKDNLNKDYLTFCIYFLEDNILQGKIKIKNNIWFLKL